MLSYIKTDFNVNVGKVALARYPAIAPADIPSRLGMRAPADRHAATEHIQCLITIVWHGTSGTAGGSRHRLV